MGRIPHSAVSDLRALEAETPARPLLRGMPAWAWALIGLLLGLASTVAVQLLERHNLKAEADLHLSQLARSSVSLLERQFETSGLLLRAMQSTYSVSGDIDQAHFEAIQRNLQRAADGAEHGRAGVCAPRCRASTGHARYVYERVAPLAGNTSLLGFDVAAQPANVRALEQARDIDQPVMSAVFALRQPTPDPDDVARRHDPPAGLFAPDSCPRAWPNAAAVKSARWP